MKQLTGFVALLGVFLLVASGCEKSKVDKKSNFDKSLAAWQDFKAISENSYQYVTGGSSWVGTSWETTITVKDGVITKRHYKLTLPEDYEGEPIPEEDKEWTETGDEVNTHTPKSLTLDEVYDSAKNYWLIERKDTTTFFETKNNGIISLCGFVPDDCQDDCFDGIKILSIVALSDLSPEDDESGS